MSGCLVAPHWRSSPPGGDQRRAGERRVDRFAELVALVAADPDNAYNIDRYRWVLDEPPAQPCARCGTLFWPGENYTGGPARGRPRRHCSRVCAQRAAWDRHWTRTSDGRWGSAA